MYIDSDGILHEEDYTGPVNVDYYITMGGETPMNGNEMGDAVPGLQADSPYTPSDQVLVAGGGETPLTSDVPYNISDVAAPNGFNSGAPGAIKDAGGVGEWITNGFKSLANGFLGGMTQQPHQATSTQAGGAFGAPGPGILGRYGTAVAPPPGSVQSSKLGINSTSLMWLVGLGVAFVLVMSIRSR